MALVAERGGYPMMQNSIVAVGLAILTALTIVAYRHPDVFSKLALALLLIALAFMIGAEAFNFGTMAAREAISASKDLDSVGIKVDPVIRAAEIPLWLWLGVPVGFTLYVLFLTSFLSLGLTQDQPPRKR
jgi:hypothetical protein